MITIELPWPSSDLSPNESVHYMVRARAVKQAKHDAHWITMAHPDSDWPEYSGDLRATWAFYPPALYHYDEDNLVGRCKAYQDAICRALGVDDLQIKKTERWMGEVDRPNGRVVMTLEAMK